MRIKKTLEVVVSFKSTTRGAQDPYKWRVQRTRILDPEDMVFYREHTGAMNNFLSTSTSKAYRSYKIFFYLSKWDKIMKLSPAKMSKKWPAEFFSWIF